MGFHEYRKIWEPITIEILEMEPANKILTQVRCSSDKEQKNYWTPSSCQNWALFQNNFLLPEMRVQ